MNYGDKCMRPSQTGFPYTCTYTEHKTQNTKPSAVVNPVTYTELSRFIRIRIRNLETSPNIEFIHALRNVKRIRMGGEMLLPFESFKETLPLKGISLKGWAAISL